MDGRPKRITVRAITVASEGRARLSKFHLSKMTVTAKLVSDAIESRHQFALRCLHWAAESFRQEKVAPAAQTDRSSGRGAENLEETAAKEHI